VIRDHQLLLTYQKWVCSLEWLLVGMKCIILRFEWCVYMHVCSVSVCMNVCICV